MTKTIFPLLIPGVLLLASCTSNPLVTADSTDAPAVEKVLLPIPPQPLVKDCGYDINDYFEALEQYNVGFGAAKKWFQSSNNGGANSNAYKRFEKNLLEFLKQSTRNETTVSLLRMEIGPHWVHSDNAYELEWYRGDGVEITRIPPDKLQKFHYSSGEWTVNTFECIKK